MPIATGVALFIMLSLTILLALDPCPLGISGINMRLKAGAIRRVT